MSATPAADVAARNAAALDAAVPDVAGTVDLHTHSTASDGVLPAAAVVEAAHAAGLAAMALTDHDTIAGVAEAQAAGERLGIDVVAGVELSAHLGSEEIHLLALHLSDVGTIAGELARFRDDRVSRAERMVARLNALGVAVTMEDVMREAGEGAVGRPHVARAVVARGGAADVREAFDRYLGDGRPAAVEKPRLAARDAIALAHAAGGIAVWAHPGAAGRRDRVEPLVTRRSGRARGAPPAPLGRGPAATDRAGRVLRPRDVGRLGLARADGRVAYARDDARAARGARGAARAHRPAPRRAGRLTAALGARMQLAGRTALVTGAGHRVGRALAVALGARGMRVAVHYRSDPDEAADTCRLVREAGGTAQAFVADLADAAAPAALVREVVDRLGALDVLINSAGVMLRTPVGEVTTDDWDAMFAINLRAPFFCAQAAAAVMAEGSAIVNIADLAALETWPAYVPHGISKAGVVQMTRALARALAPRIRVNAIAPGTVLLPEGWDDSSAERLRSTTPLQRNGSPDDVVRAMLYLLDAEFVTGDVLVVDGGRHIRV